MNPNLFLLTSFIFCSIKRIATLSLCFVIFLLSGCSSDAYFEDALCISNVTIVDPIDGLKENMNVIIQENRIATIFSSDEKVLSSKNVIIDGTGKFLIPGLWDAHVHFAFIEDLAPSMFDLFLAYGVTSVRDTGGELKVVKEWRTKALADPNNAPRVLIAGPLLDGLPNVYDGSSLSRPPLSVGLADSVEVADYVQSLVDEEVDLVKAYEMLSPDQLIAIVKIAEENGLKVTGHIPLSMDAITAANAGMSSFEHLRNLEFSFAANSDELLAERREMLARGKSEQGGVLRSSIHEAQRMNAIANSDSVQTYNVLKALKQNDTWQVPTLSIMTAITKRHFLTDDWKAVSKKLPQPVSENWQEGAKVFEDRPVNEDRQVYTDWMLSTTQKMNEHGINLMAGTDCPIFYLIPGHSLHNELVLLVEAGLTPQEALATATIQPAKYFGIDGELGLVKENYMADLVLLDKNPLDDIANTRTIEGVIRNGKWHPIDSLIGRLK